LNFGREKLHRVPRRHDVASLYPTAAEPKPVAIHFLHALDQAGVQFGAVLILDAEMHAGMPSQDGAADGKCGRAIAGISGRARENKEKQSNKAIHEMAHGRSLPDDGRAPKQWRAIFHDERVGQYEI
jgi:hypothetical protein